MIQTIKNNITKILIAAALLVPVLVPVTVSAQADIQNGLKQGSCLDVSAECDVSESPDQINSLIATVINIFSVVVGVVAVIMIIIGGLKYITSSGDSNNVTSAKNTILYAIIGIVIAFLAFAAVRFVTDQLQKATYNGSHVAVVTKK